MFSHKNTHRDIDTHDREREREKEKGGERERERFHYSRTNNLLKLPTDYWILQLNEIKFE